MKHSIKAVQGCLVVWVLVGCQGTNESLAVVPMPDTIFVPSDVIAMEPKQDKQTYFLYYQDKQSVRQRLDEQGIAPLYEYTLIDAFAVSLTPLQAAHWRAMPDVSIQKSEKVYLDPPVTKTHQQQ